MLVGRLLGSSILALAALTPGKTSHEANKNEINTSPLVARNDIPSVNYKHNNLIQFEHNKEENLNGKICRAFIPSEPKGKPLFVLVLGHVQELDFTSNDSGIIYLFEKLKKEEKGIVLLFRTGLATDEIGSMISSDYKSQYEPKTVFKQSKEIIQDFITKYNPKEIRLGGFSWGGGTIAELARDDNWSQSIPVMRTVMIDPISFGSFGIGSALRTRPEFKNSSEHKNFHIYQRRDNLSMSEWVTTIQGNYPVKFVKDKEGKLKAVKDERIGDVIWHVPNTSHLRIDGLSEVREKAYEFLTSEEKSLYTSNR